MSAPKATIIYKPGEVYFDLNTGYRYCKLGFDNQRVVSVLLEPPDAEYTQYQVVGAVAQSGLTWRDLPSALETGKYVVELTLSARASLITPQAGPWALEEGMRLTVESLSDAGALLTETFLVQSAHYEDVSAATAGELAAAINAQLVGVTAVDLDGRLTLRSARAKDGFIRVSSPDAMEEVLGLIEDYACTCYSVTQEARNEPAWRGLGAQTKRIFVRFGKPVATAGEGEEATVTASDWVGDWVVYDITLPIQPRQVRNLFGFGLPLVRLDGTPFSDVDLYKVCLSAISHMEKFLRIYLTPTRLLARPDLRVPAVRARFDYDYADDPYDWDARDAMSWSYLTLRHYPVIGTPKVKLVYINNQEVLDIPQEWLKVHHRTGQVNITPGGTGMTNYAIGLGGRFLPLTGIGLSGNIPQYIWIDSTVGFESGQIPPVVWEHICKLAAVSLFTIAPDGQEFGAASRSLSDGVLSQSVTNTGSGQTPLMGARIKQYKDEIADFERRYRGAFRRPPVTVI